jgi:NDP-sugar pyrophosphorylase family protein
MMLGGRMSRNLLIVGAGSYGVVAKEIAESMQCFDRIAYVDDKFKESNNGLEILGTVADVKKLTDEFGDIIVAIGNVKIRLNIIKKLKEELNCNVTNLISKYAYVSPSVKLGNGCIIEPMAVVHTGAVLSDGCIISAGAVVAKVLFLKK